MKTLIYAAILALAIAFTFGCEEKSGSKTEATAAADSTKPEEQTGSDTLVIDKTSLIIITAKFSDLVAEYGEENAEVVADDGNWYQYQTIEFFEKLGIKTGYDENKRYLSFAIDNGKNYVIDSKTESGVYLYKKGKEPMSIAMAEGGYPKDQLKIFAKYLQMDLSDVKKRVQSEEEIAKEAAEEEALAKATIEYLNAAREKALKEEQTLTDERDGKTYMWTKIDKQIWMSENLNYKAEGSKCNDDSESNCQKYGRLYNWEAAIKACPKGWHLPQDAEWNALITYVEKDKSCTFCGDHLKAASGWSSNGNGTDIYGFSALPGGGGYSDGNFFGVGVDGSGNWWSASKVNADSTHTVKMISNWRGIDRGDNRSKDYFLSVRCVKD